MCNSTYPGSIGLFSEGDSLTVQVIPKYMSIFNQSPLSVKQNGDN